jgi:hypothetical protein
MSRLFLAESPSRVKNEGGFLVDFCVGAAVASEDVFAAAVVAVVLVLAMPAGYCGHCHLVVHDKSDRLRCYDIFQTEQKNGTAEFDSQAGDPW